MPSPRHSVALVVIARDEAERIARLLHSVRPHVDRMLLLDTGSTDATAAIAAACGAVVAHLPWPDDFAAARNHALALAQADWHLVLDADEWLIDGGEALQALRRLPPTFVGALQLRDQFSQGPQATHDGHTAHTSAWLSRVLPGAVRYAGRVHEQPQHALPLRRLAVQIGHDGYLPERLATKRGRNRRLLQAALSASPESAYLHFQLGKDCAVYDEHADAEAAFVQAVARAGELERRQAWWLDLVARRLYSLKCLKRHAQGLDFAELQMARAAESPDFYFVLGDLLLDLAADDPAQAQALLPLIEQAWRQCLALGERPDQAGAVAGRGSHWAAHNLALVLEMTGRDAEAADLRATFPVPC